MGVLNKIQLIGYIGHSPRYIKPKDYQVVSVSLATNEECYRHGEWVIITEWHNLIFLGKLASAVTNLQRGNQLYIEGRLRSHYWIDNQGTNRKSFDIIVQSMQLLDKTKCDNLPEQIDKLTPEDYISQMHAILESHEEHH